MIIRILLAIFAITFAGCASAPEAIIGVDNEEKPARSVKGAKQRTIFIATTRQPDNAATIMFSGERNNRLSLARVTVSIPPNHVPGRIERPTSLPPDPEREFAILDPVLYQSQKSFVAGLDKELVRLPKQDRNVLLFVHGYNTTLAAAILRTAQFVEDANFDGIALLFTWASRGSALSYVYDINSALHARDALLETAIAVNNSKAAAFDVLAHSMGNLLTVEAMRQAQLKGLYNKNGRVRTVVLASPDIDKDVFAKQISVFPKEQRNFFVLISEDDKALAFSKRIAGGIDRVGDASAEELADLGVTVIDLSKVDDENNLNHSKFADSPEVVKLIGTRLNAGDRLGTQGIARGETAGIRSIPGLTATSIGLGILAITN